MSISTTGFGPYTFQRELGSDATGVFYLADKDGVPLPVVVQVFKPEYTENSEAVKAFEADVQLVYGLNHRSIVQLLDQGRHEGQLYLATEFLDTEDLQERLDKRNLPRWNESCRLAVQVLDTLQYVHEQGTAHGDFKPANVLIDKDKQVVLTGFGISRLLHPGATPEAAADTYSMALTLYEMLTGIRPDPGPANPTIPRPEILNRDLPVALGDVLLKALSPDLFDRPPAGVLARQIKQVLFSEEAEPTVPQGDRDIEQMTAVLCATPTSEESKGRLAAQFRGSDAYSFQWLPEGALVLYRSPAVALEVARATSELFAEEHLSFMLATGSMAVDPSFALRRPQLGEYACEPVEKAIELLRDCPPGAVRVDAATADNAPEGFFFREVSPGVSELAPVEPTLEALPAVVPEPTPEPPRAPLSLEERAQRKRSGELPQRPRSGELPTFAPPPVAANRGLMGTVMVPLIQDEPPAWKKALLPLLLGVVAGGAYLAWRFGGSPPTTLEINTVPKKVRLLVDKGPAEIYTSGTEMEIKPGKHFFKVSATGYVPWQAYLTVNEGDSKTLHVKLKKSKKK